MHKLGVLAVDAEILQFLEGEQIQFSDFELLAGLSNLQRIRLENLSINLKGSKPRQLRSVKKLDIKSCSFMSDDDLPLELCDMFPNLVLLTITNCFVSIADLNHLRSLSLIDCCPMKLA
ncbi:putative leucine-rich repeat domain, L domain-containing protein [Rosa chinensis]|uniref:Putative leucine-rich repeat domain, L domain-containing protein n=1 Tax=Rosa chinensis TaxID=74649 RepID=A0A2P6RKE0_ROSCH|nr:putative leucine-rich repeat domain, L domain-containing protein [Rosa chinensis]